MNLEFKRKIIRPTHTGSLVELYPHDLQLYKVPPIQSVTLQEFEDLAIERLKVLRILASVTTLKGFKIYSKEWKAAVIDEMTKEGLKGYAHSCKSAGFSTSEADLQLRRRDHISHFILRLAYCRTEELRRWFTAREMELFKFRFQSLTNEGIQKFFQINNLNYEPISKDEKSRIYSNLSECTFGFSHAKTETVNFFKVKFYEVLDLVKSRKVFLENSFAYIPSTEFVSVLSSQYRAHLNQALATANRRLPEVEHDERLVGLLKGLHNSYTGTDYSNSNQTTLPIESLDSLSIKAFPLCMRQLHEHLRANHHLKHGGRIQFGLFLKAAGVTLEDSLRFWREEFTKKMELDKFEKQYAYNVRYNYGKEGSRKNYTAYSCMKIIQGNVGPGENHGCPFRHSDGPTLKNKLLGYGVNPQAISNIVELASNGHYQIACSKYFDITHNIHIELGVNHPNQYFEESQNVTSGHAKPNLDTSKGQSMYTHVNQSSQNDGHKDEDDLFDNEMADAELSMMDIDM